MASLTRQYVSDSTGQRWTLQAFAAPDAHPQLAGGRPWFLRALPNGPHEFFVNLGHAVFMSTTMTPLDGLLAELAWSAMEFIRGGNTNVTFGLVLAELRARYAAQSSLDAVVLSTEARQTMNSIAAAVSRGIEPSDAPVLFKELSLDDQKAILQRMAMRGAPNAQSIIATGRFLEYAPLGVLPTFFRAHPELFLDGRCWDEEYSSLNYELPDATAIAQQRIVRRYDALLTDAVWLAEQDPGDLTQATRARLLRAACALELLAPIATSEEQD
jgi:hypothetical protein